MEKPIGAGDLVKIVRWSCCGKFVGRTFFVTKDIEIGPWRYLVCSVCREPFPSERHVYGSSGQPLGLSAPVSWVKRIDPPSDPVVVRHDEEITA